MDKIQAYFHKALQYHQRADYVQAELFYKKALEQDPVHAFSLNNLASVYNAQDKAQLALEFALKALSARPDYPEAIANCGVSYCSLGDFDVAERCFKRLVSEFAHVDVGYINLSGFYNERKQPDEAFSVLQQGLKKFPQNPQLLFHLGLHHKAVGDYTKALEVLENLLSQQPHDLQVQVNVALLYYDLGELTEARKRLQDLLQKYPKNADLHCDMAWLCRDEGDIQAALNHLDEALACDPKSVRAHYERGLVLNKLGRYTEGWQEFEWRLRDKACLREQSCFDMPLWQGEDISQKTVLVLGEQGIADELRYVKFLPQLAKRAKKVVYECHPKLFSLMTRSFPSIEVHARDIKRPADSPRAQSQDIDYFLYAGSLMQHFWGENDLSGYLKADPDKVDFWKQRLNSLGGVKTVGLSWRSGFHNQCVDQSLRQKGNVALTEWEPVFQNIDAAWVNLQYSDVSGELASIRESCGVCIHDWEDLDQTNDLDALAAVICCLDLVVSIDSVASILGGALGQPVWMLSPFVHSNHLPSESIDEAWFSSIKILAQRYTGEWGSVMGHLRKKL